MPSTPISVSVEPLTVTVQCVPSNAIVASATLQLKEAVSSPEPPSKVSVPLPVLSAKASSPPRPKNVTL